MRTLRLVVILIAVSYPQCSLATLVVGRRTPTEVVVGADSIQGSVRTGRVVGSVCKIAQAGRMFFATAGLMGFTVNDNDRTLLFGGRVPVLARYAGSSLKNFVIDNVTNSESVLHASGLLAARLEEPLREMLTWHMRRVPQYYSENLLNKVFTYLVLFAWENDSPILAVLDFEAIEGMDKLPQVKPSMIRSHTIMAGWKRDVVHLINDNTFWKGDPVEKVKTVIESQIQATPDKVKAPIDILQVDKAGPQWIQRKSECPDVTLPR
jgi:hypothetical protein